MMKLCKKCENEKPIEEFPNAKGYKDGHHPWCRSCRAEYQRNYNKTYPRKKDKNARRTHVFRKYGLTPERYDEILQAQGGVCLGCGRNPSDSTREFAVDHDHSCCPGKESCGECVRGILCGKCNSALGMVDDNIQTLTNLVSYLSKLRP